jgi:hypothetical protein
MTQHKNAHANPRQFKGKSYPSRSTNEEIYLKINLKNKKPSKEVSKYTNFLHRLDRQ